MIHAETCTAFICLLIELFGETPGPDLLTGVAIDRGRNEPKGNHLTIQGFQMGLYVFT